MRGAAEVLHLPKVSPDIPNLPNPSWKRPPLTKQKFTLPIQSTRAVNNALCHKVGLDILLLPKGTRNQKLQSKRTHNFPSIQKGLPLLWRESEAFYLSPRDFQSSTSTTTTTRPRYTPYTQEAIKTSLAVQESFNSSTDVDSPNGSVTSSSSPQSDDVKHPDSTKEDLRHALSVQEGQKASTNAIEGLGALCLVQWELIYSPVPNVSATSFPVV